MASIKSQLNNIASSHKRRGGQFQDVRILAAELKQSIRNHIQSSIMAANTKDLLVSHIEINILDDYTAEVGFFPDAALMRPSILPNSHEQAYIPKIYEETNHYKHNKIYYVGENRHGEQVAFNLAGVHGKGMYCVYIAYYLFSKKYEYLFNQAGASIRYID